MARASRGLLRDKAARRLAFGIPAYFLRGWAAYRKDPNSVAALIDIQHAAELTPTDTLYSQSVTFLNANAGQPTDAQAAEVAT